MRVVPLLDYKIMGYPFRVLKSDVLSPDKSQPSISLTQQEVEHRILVKGDPRSRP
jgi:hypothetical protein